MKESSVIDLYCGIGGLTHGFIKEGFNVTAGIDIDESCKYAFEENNNADFINMDLVTTHPDDILELFSNGTKILVGCAPCQAFSNYSNNKSKNDKWKLVYTFGNLIDSIQPELVSMENVGQLLTYNSGKVFKDFHAKLSKNGYHIFYKVVNAQDYGVPQRRFRLVLLASKLGPIELIPPTHDKNNYVSVRNAIEHLPPLSAGETCESDILHKARALTELNLRRIKATPEGGSWKDWADELVLECHKKESGKSFGSVYGRMVWDDVSPTLTTQCTGYGNGRYGHPKQDRAITFREAAILQSFPDEYKFINPNKPLSTPSIERHIGNAVPVKLAQAIATSIKKHLIDYEKDTKA